VSETVDEEGKTLSMTEGEEKGKGAARDKLQRTTLVPCDLCCFVARAQLLPHVQAPSTYVCHCITRDTRFLASSIRDSCSFGSKFERKSQNRYKPKNRQFENNNKVNDRALPTRSPGRGGAASTTENRIIMHNGATASSH